MMGFRKKYVVMVKGTHDSRVLYDISCIINMTTNTNRIKYLATGTSDQINMLGYKASREDQESLRNILKDNYPELSFVYLNKCKTK